MIETKEHKWWRDTDTKRINRRLSSDRVEMEPEIVLCCAELEFIYGLVIILRLKKEKPFKKLLESWNAGKEGGKEKRRKGWKRNT
jgi:hypothetical protein